MDRHCYEIDPFFETLFNKDSDHVIVCKHIGHTYKKEGKNGEKWVGILVYNSKSKGKWDVWIICTNVASKRHNEYGLTGTTLMNFFEQQHEIHVGDQMCLYHDPKNEKMKKLADALEYSKVGDGYGVRTKHKGNPGTEHIEEGSTIEECKKRSRSSSTSSDSQGSKDGGKDGEKTESVKEKKVKT